MPAAATPALYVDRFRGASIHARGIGLAGVYLHQWTPHGRWTEHKHVPWCWEHPHYPRHVLWTPDPGVTIVTKLGSSMPRVAPLLAMGEEAFGAGARPVRLASYPLSFRIALCSLGAVGLPIPPDEGMHCRPIWPLKDKPSCIISVEGRDVELRLSASRHGDGLLHFYAEAFLGHAPVTNEGAPRSLLYSADSRHFLMDPDPARLKRFTARAMDWLILFADTADCFGLLVDRARRPHGRQVGKVRIAEGADDVEFAIRVPQPDAPALKFIGSRTTP